MWHTFAVTWALLEGGKACGGLGTSENTHSRRLVNKGKRKGRGTLAPALLGISSSYYLGSLVTFTLSTEARKGP
jgi:hypothetical protein